MRPRIENNSVAGKFVDYLVERRGLSQSEIAEILDVDKSFVSRVRNRERGLSPEQMRAIADALDAPLGAMVLEALGPIRSTDPQKRKIAELCVELLRTSDKAIAAFRAERAAKAAAKGTA